jgi:hypothetical protein
MVQPATRGFSILFVAAGSGLLRGKGQLGGHCPPAHFLVSPSTPHRARRRPCLRPVPGRMCCRDSSTVRRPPSQLPNTSNRIRSERHRGPPSEKALQRPIEPRAVLRDHSADPIIATGRLRATLWSLRAAASFGEEQSRRTLRTLNRDYLVDQEPGGRPRLVSLRCLLVPARRPPTGTRCRRSRRHRSAILSTHACR